MPNIWRDIVSHIIFNTIIHGFSNDYNHILGIHAPDYVYNGAVNEKPFNEWTN